mgnify:CR=1 FL=1
MSMQSLNHLVARSIIDPDVVMMFDQGRIGQVLDELDFSKDLREHLQGISAGSWADFAVQAYRVVKTAQEQADQSIQLPSPLEGLERGSSWSDQEQVA